MLPGKPSRAFILEPQLVLGYKETAGKRWRAAVCAAWDASHNLGVPLQLRMLCHSVLLWNPSPDRGLGCKEGEKRRAGFFWSPAQGVKQLSQLSVAVRTSQPWLLYAVLSVGWGAIPTTHSSPPWLTAPGCQSSACEASLGRELQTTEGLMPVPSSPRCALGCAEPCQSGKRGV